MKVKRGQEIQDLARFVFYAWCIVWIIFCIAIGSLFGKIMHGDGWVGWVLGIVIAGINIIIGDLVYVMVDAYGVITDCNEKQTALLEKLCSETAADNSKSAVKKDTAVYQKAEQAVPEKKPEVKKNSVTCTPSIEGENLTCTKCGAVQKANRSSCFKCGAEFIK